MGTSCGVHCASGLLKLTCNGGKVHLLVQSGLSTATNLAQPLHARVTEIPLERDNLNKEYFVGDRSSVLFGSEDDRLLRSNNTVW